MSLQLAVDTLYTQLTTTFYSFIPYQLKANSCILIDRYSIFIIIYTHHFKRVTVVMFYHDAYFLQAKSICDKNWIWKSDMFVYM